MAEHLDDKVGKTLSGIALIAASTAASYIGFAHQEEFYQLFQTIPHEAARYIAMGLTTLVTASGVGIGLGKGLRKVIDNYQDRQEYELEP